jgi:hypothetical protein
MTRSLFAAAVIGIVAIAAPRPASGQHTPSSGATSSGTATSSGGGGSSSGGSSSGGSSSASGSSSGSSGGFSTDSGRSDNSNGSGRRRGNSPVTGTATPRTGQPGGGGGPISIGAGGFYPWGYVYGGGLGIYDSFYGGYYGAYDPWFGFSPIYAPSSYASNESGSIRLKVKPSNASVYVDGYYVGVVDDFDGTFQRLHLEPGPHRLEIRAVDYQPLALDVWITEDLTITYRGDLRTQ